MVGMLFDVAKQAARQTLGRMFAENALRAAGYAAEWQIITNSKFERGLRQ